MTKHEELAKKARDIAEVCRETGRPLLGAAPILEELADALAALPAPPGAGEPERMAMRGVVGNVLCNASNYPCKAGVHVLGQDMGPLIDRTVDAILAKWPAREPEPCTVTTVEELDALPVGSVVRSAAGTIAARFDGYHGTIFGDDRPFPWMSLALPVRILFTPSTEETP